MQVVSCRNSGCSTVVVVVVVAVGVAEVWQYEQVVVVGAAEVMRSSSGRCRSSGICRSVVEVAQ